MNTTIGPEWPTGQAVERAEEALHEAGWFGRADLHPDTIRALLWDLADAGLLT